MFRTQFWQNLPQEAKSTIDKNTHFRPYKKGAVIYSPGERPIGMYLVRKGLVGLVKTSAKGTDHLLRLFTQQQFFGHRTLFAGETYYAKALCLEPSEIGLVPSRVVEDIVQRFPEAARVIIATLAKELGLAEELRLRIADQEVIMRIASSIIYLKELDGQHRWTRNEIANYCASTGPTVIRGLGYLESQGLIKQQGRDIEILDRQKLIKIAHGGL